MDKYFKKSTSILAIACLTLFLLNCSATKKANVYSINTDGVFEAQIERMNKDAIRVKGQIMTKAKKVADRYEYEFKVTEVVRLGSTFSDAEPKADQVVLLYTPGIKFDKDSQVMFDAFSTPKRSEERLTLNMIVE